MQLICACRRPVADDDDAEAKLRGKGKGVKGKGGKSGKGKGGGGGKGKVRRAVLMRLFAAWLRVTSCVAQYSYMSGS